MTEEIVLSVAGAGKTYRKRSGAVVRALQDATLTLRAGMCAVVRGPSGCGKTTLLLTAGGLLAPDEGSVSVTGTDLYSLSPEARARFRARAIGFVFQQFHLIPYLSVRDNVLVPALAGGGPELRDRADDLIREFGLEDRRDHPPSELSTGERQRTALARALLLRPRLLLADEPTGNLDERNAGAVAAHLKAFAADGGAVLIATHDPRLGADWVAEMVDGRLRNGKGAG